MRKLEIVKLQKNLEAVVIELDHSVRRRDAIHVEQTSDALDRQMGATERELAVRNLEAVSVARREAYEALRRIRTGTYGTCQECEDPIHPTRLAAIPWAMLCIHCQEAADRKQPYRAARQLFAMAA